MTLAAVASTVFGATMAFMKPNMDFLIKKCEMLQADNDRIRAQIERMGGVFAATRNQGQVAVGPPIASGPVAMESCRITDPDPRHGDLQFLYRQDLKGRAAAEYLLLVVSPERRPNEAIWAKIISVDGEGRWSEEVLIGREDQTERGQFRIRIFASDSSNLAAFTQIARSFSRGTESRPLVLPNGVSPCSELTVTRVP
jgi:hypothetical protein